MASSVMGAVASFCIAMLVLAAAVTPTLAKRNSENSKTLLRVSPALDPASHTKFYKEDYPDDDRPDAAHHFNYPYPIMQESRDFDKDYIKDENADGGEWKAQEDYDRLRIEIVKLRANATKMAEWERKAREEWEEAEKKAKDAAQNAEAADATTAELRKKLKDAEDLLANLTGGANGSDSSVGTDKEESELEKCLKALAKAQAELDKLLAERARREEKRQAKVDEAASADDAESAALREEEAVAEKLRLAQQDYDAALKKYEAEKKKLELMLADLDASAARLRKFRAKDIDQDGGVYRVHKSAAGRFRPSLLVVASALAVLFAAYFSDANM